MKKTLIVAFIALGSLSLFAQREAEVVVEAEPVDKAEAKPQHTKITVDKVVPQVTGKAERVKVIVVAVQGLR